MIGIQTLGVRLTEESGVNISDSVVMGDIQQNITNVQQNITQGTSCPRCGVINARIMQCSIPDCSHQFCGLCHPKCRWANNGVSRFDSGDGLGPFCGECMDLHMKMWKEEEAVWAKQDELSSFRMLAIWLTVFLGLVAYVDPSFPVCTLIIGIPVIASWMRFFATKGEYRRLIQE